MNSLFSKPVDANLICAVKLLKVWNVDWIILQTRVEDLHQAGNEDVFFYILYSQLTGSILDDAWKESGKPHMEELIRRIETILLDATCSRCVNQRVLFCVQLQC